MEFKVSVAVTQTHTYDASIVHPDGVITGLKIYGEMATVSDLVRGLPIGASVVIKRVPSN
jgi:hypothetical protein